MSDEGPKSALDVVMERLRQKDAAAGVELTKLTDEQKAAIAEARNVLEAKRAERQILYAAAIAGVWDPAARAAAEDEHRRELARLQEDCDRKIEKIRGATR